MLDQTHPKFAFWLGVSQGVALSFIVGFFLLLNMVVGGNVLSAGNKLAKANNNPPANVQQPQDPSQPPAPTGPIAVKITNTDHVLGSSNAKVTMVEYSDFQCPFCGRFFTTVKQAMTEYKDKIRFVYRNFPLDSIHPNARPAAEAAECAGEQGKYWEYHDKLFANQEKLADSLYPQLASELKLNVNKFNDCLKSDKYISKIDADYQQGITDGVQGTPHTLINGVAISGAVPYEQLKAAIDAALK